ncbi:MAG: hypothetical protein IJP48_03375 [Synergistaceae bacterium]|nr:hypothetical protein [Synergistaceae bacterium]
MKQSLKKLAAVFVFAALLAVVLASTASAAYNLNFTLYNYTNYDITGIMASPSEESRWDPDLDSFSPGYVKRGTRSEMSFQNASSYRKNQRYWDLRLYYAGEWHQFRHIPLSRVRRVYIDRQGNMDWE